MVRVPVVGAERDGGEVAYNLVFERYVTELFLIDIAPKVAQMSKDELCHAIASHGFDVKIEAYEDCKHVKDADLIVVAAGFPRIKEASRRELANRINRIVHEIVLNTLENNSRAWYFVMTNPVNAMMTLANKTPGA